MPFDFSTLITDRSQADIEALESILGTPMSDWTTEQLAAFNAAKDKGAYNYTDLNRVAQAVDYLASTFKGYGYAVPDYVQQSTWAENDAQRVSQMAQFLTNIQAVRSALAVLSTTPETPESMAALTWAEANNIEQILLNVEALIAAMSQVFLRSDMVWAISGGPKFYFSN